jgi:nucleoid-associated protein YgaU
MLLCLDPTDADASLLLGKVLARRNQWQEALAHIDSAISNGSVAPPGLRDHVEINLRRQVEADEQRRARLTAREQGEIQNLRREAKRLRSDNAALDAQVDDLQKRVRIWSSVTALIAGSASALLIASLLLGGNSNENTAPLEEADVITAPASGTAVVADPMVADPMVADPMVAEPMVAEPMESEPVVAEPEPLNTAPVAADPVDIGPEYPLTHTVKSGDNLGKISERYYGKASLYDYI